MSCVLFVKLCMCVQGWNCLSVLGVIICLTKGKETLLKTLPNMCIFMDIKEIIYK